MSELTPSTVERTFCAEHPDVETALQCSKCGKFICPRCLVQTPVGARCRDCARLQRIPTYRMDSRDWAQAIGGTIGAAVVGGIVWSLIGGIAGGFFAFFIAMALGYGIGEIVSAAVNRKRGTALQVLAGLAVFGAFVVRQVIGIVALGLPLTPALLGTAIVGSLSQIWTLLMLIIAIALGVSRMRG